MKITYLGTAAFEGIPALFCSCATCNEARRLGGKNLRTRSQALINDDLLIDFNADTFSHFFHGNHDIRKVKDCLITHSHCDHFYFDDIEMARKDFVHGYDGKINYYGGKTVYDRIKEYENRSWMDGVFTVNEVHDNEMLHLHNYDVLPLNANHDQLSCPFIYLISDGKKRMLYGNDTGELFEDNYPKMKQFGHLDLVSLDCTGQIQYNWRGSHMSLDVVLEVLEKMKKEGIIDDTTKVVVTHFSHNGGCNYDTMQEACAKHNIIVAYDGLEIEF